MAQNSKIEWTDHTVNLWWGCSKVRTGCKNCYAENLSNRFGDNVWGEKAPRKRIKSAFKDLSKYQKQGEKEGRMIRVFVGSMMDIFEDSKSLMNPDEKNNYLTTSQLRLSLFYKINRGLYPNITFLFLTKRPENILDMIPLEWIGNFPENVWFGISVSDQKTYDELQNLEINYLGSGQLLWELKNWHSANIFLSIEPQVEEIDLRQHALTKPDWIIQGGESGPNKRPFDVEWGRSMRDQCRALGIPYFFKQIDKIQPIPKDLEIREFPEFSKTNLSYGHNNKPKNQNPKSSKLP